MRRCAVAAWESGCRCDAARRRDPGILKSLVRARTARRRSLRTLPGGLTIHAISAPYFLGTKIEAFRGRGKGDYFASRDLEDMIAVVDGRASLLDELQSRTRGLTRLRRRWDPIANLPTAFPRCLARLLVARRSQSGAYLAAHRQTEPPGQVRANRGACPGGLFLRDFGGP